MKAGSSSKAMPPAARAAREILAAYGSEVVSEAVHLVTPIPSTVSVGQLTVDPKVLAFVRAYEPKTDIGGVYAHQARVLGLLGGAPRSVVLTTSTGSGKSLAFWAWAFDLLRRDPRATVLACFPTQALLWGQADRLRKISAQSSVVLRNDQAFAGQIQLAATSVPWSVWYGTSNCEDMRAQEKSESFEEARIRLCTFDKAHWSLMRKEHAPFLRRLAGVIADEGHVWQGVSGAHVRRMFDRMRVSLHVLGCSSPAFFVASATLPDARRFAHLLTGEAEDRFELIDDGAASKYGLVSAARVPDLLQTVKGTSGLHRFVLLLQPQNERGASEALLSNATIMGTDSAALCFVPSKFAGHRLSDTLNRTLKARRAVAYDADMTAKDRRKTEREFQTDQEGVTYVATSALEVGVDLPALDLVVMDELPPRRSDLLQRLGRVGRSAERPGLGVLLMGHGPAEERLAEAPASLTNIPARPASLPLHLDSLRLKAIKACRAEWDGRLSKQGARARFDEALRTYLGEALSDQELDSRIERELEGLLDLDDGAWYYKGFRASASQGKIPLVLAGTQTPVAQIQDIAIFRDAHPEAVYLGHRGERFRVVHYKGSFTLAQWTHPNSSVVLGKFMHQLREVVVEPVAARVATRGAWVDRFSLYERKDLPPDAEEPVIGALEYGVWDFRRRFDGYREVDLARGGKVTRVTLNEVSSRFKQALDEGTSFPFLHDFVYRTLGWQWQIARLLPSVAQREALALVVETLLHAWFSDAAECAPSDLGVELSVDDATLRVVDTTPGGSGLAAALLEGRVAGALEALLRAIQKAARGGASAFQSWLVAEYALETTLDPKELLDAVAKLESAWRTSGARPSTP